MANCPKFLVLIVLAFVPVSVIEAHASWFSEVTGIDVNVPAGTISIKSPRPDKIPEALQHAPQDIGQALLNPAGATLAAAIRHASAQKKYGSKSIPDNIRAKLSPYFPADILNRVRWNTYSGGSITLDSLILGTESLDMAAITLDDVIVFKNGQNGENDFLLWAHELVHATQYANMGVEGFANMYTIAFNTMESQARDYAAKVGNNIKATAQPVQQRWSVNNEYAIGSSTLSPGDFHAAVMNVYPARNFVQWQTMPYGVRIWNNSVVPIYIGGCIVVNPYNGSQIGIPCISDCIIPPGWTKDFSSPAPGMPVAHVSFSFAQ